MAQAHPHGLHHVTAVARDPRQNIGFYTDVLGLRMVKRTVNFDEPETYHLYYGDESGSPSTLLTFFPWPHVMHGRMGAGLAYSTALSVPEHSVGWWEKRLRDHGADVLGIAERAGEEVLSFRDHDGLLIDLVATEDDTRSGWDGVADVPADHAIRGLHTVTLAEPAPDRTAAVLVEVLGMSVESDRDGRARFTMAGGGSGRLLDLAASGTTPGVQGGGTVHHVALRAPDESTLADWRDGLVEAGAQVTAIRDRYYFLSIYFREPGGVLLEIATERPGFTVDEPLLELGRRLSLPPWLEPDRAQIERDLPPAGDEPR